jgi:gliding motility-associated-like protein
MVPCYLLPAAGSTCFTYTPNDEYNGQDTVCIVTCAGSVCDTTIIIITVTPVNDPPVAVDDSETTPEDTPVDIDVTDNDFDIDGVIDPTTVTEVTPPSNGSITIDPNTGVITYTPNTDFVGTDEFIYSVCDNGSPVLCDEAVVTVTVIPTPDTTYIPTPEEVPFTVCTDSLTNFGGEPITSVNVCGQPSNGVLTPEVGTTCFTYTPNDEYNGQDTVCIVTCAGTVCDTTIVIITITPVNDPPVAVDDSETTQEDTPVDIDVTVNDFDIDGVINPTTVTVLTDPTNGTVVNNGDGTITYSPNPDFVGVDEFTYSVCDNGMPVLCDIAVVTITVTPTPDTTFLTTDEDTPIDFCTLDNLNFGSSPIVSVSVCGEPANGTISPAAGTTCFTYTSDPDWNGNDTLCIVTCAANGLCDTTIVIITVNPVNDPPVAVDDNASTQEDTPVDIDVTVNDFDIDGPLDPASVTVTNGPANGTTTVDPETGIITYTPNQDFIGIDTFTYAVCDTGSPVLCDTAIVVITVTPMSDTIFAVLDEDTEILLCTESVAQIEGPIITIVACEDPVHGTISVEPSLCITYVPDANYNGLDSMCIISCNDQGQCDTTIIMIEVLPVNDPPVANDDFANTDINTPVTIDVIENDNDAIDGGQIDPTSVDVIVDPVFGSVVTNQDGTVTYTPVDGFIGIDSFAYVVCDLGIPLPSLCDTAYVFVNVSPLSGDDCFIPNSFSPNGDGNFDNLNIPCADYFPDLELLVYNRWGDQVYASGIGYQNNWNGIWDKKGVDLPDGTYYWIVKFNDGFSKDRAGYISLLR